MDEDPVTGAAHCCMGVYWTKRLRADTAYQASPRGGIVNVRIEGEGGSHRHGCYCLVRA
ncbi:MAG: PhzF family phenazine biosynthesis protein [Thermodesulfobacteriota bacterium]